MRKFLIFVALAGLVSSDIALARCGGANGYCTRSAWGHREQAAMPAIAAYIVALQQEEKRLSRHKHHTWAARVADHKRLDEVRLSISRLPQ